MSEHYLARIESRPQAAHVAVCHCGWRSPSYSTAGLAGAALDGHVAETEQDADDDQASAGER